MAAFWGRVQSVQLRRHTTCPRLFRMPRPRNFACLGGLACLCFSAVLMPKWDRLGEYALWRLCKDLIRNLAPPDNHQAPASGLTGRCEQEAIHKHSLWKPNFKTRRKPQLGCVLVFGNTGSLEERRAQTLHKPIAVPLWFLSSFSRLPPLTGERFSWWNAEFSGQAAGWLGQGTCAKSASGCCFCLPIPFSNLFFFFPCEKVSEPGTHLRWHGKCRASIFSPRPQVSQAWCQGLGGSPEWITHVVFTCTLHLFLQQGREEERTSKKEGKKDLEL